MTTELTGIYVSGLEPKPPALKPRAWDWIKYYAFNLYRKPFVWKRQQELKKIFSDIRNALDQDLLPHLWQNRTNCQTCRIAYDALRGQVFTSMIQMVLRNLQCEEHFELYAQFLVRHNAEFLRSDEIARWINNI